jgi:hypothetical protein
MSQLNNELEVLEEALRASHSVTYLALEYLHRSRTAKAEVIPFPNTNNAPPVYNQGA